MYRIFVSEKDYEKKVLKVTVFVLQYDTVNKTHNALPDDTPFFLDFLLHHNVKNDGYIRVLTDKFQPYNDDFLANNVHHFITKIEQTNTRNYPLKKWLKKYHKKYVAESENDNIVQADYTIFLTDELYMDHIFEGFSYNIPCRNLTAHTPQKQILATIPNIGNINVIENIIPNRNDIATPIQIKFSNDSNYIFLTTENDKLSVIDTNKWLLHWEINIQDAYATIFEDTKNNLIWLQDYNEVLEAFETKTSSNTTNIPEIVDYFMSQNLNLMTHWEEKSPIQIYNKNNEIVLSVPEKQQFQTLNFSKNEKLIALAYNKEINIWDVKKQELIKAISFEKGVLHKIIFSHDSNLLFLLVDDIAIYAIDIESENIVFTHQKSDKDVFIKDFDITDKYYCVLEINTTEKKHAYMNYSCNVYPIGCTEFEIDNILFNKLKKQASEKRTDINRWAKVLASIENNWKTSAYIYELKKDLYSYWNWINMGVELERQKLYEQDIQCLNIALEIAPNETTTIYNLGTAYMKLKDYSTAAYYLQLCINKNPKYRTAYINLGMTYLKAKILDKCEIACLDGINAKDIPECYLNLGHAYYVQNRIEDAKKVYLQGLKKYSTKVSFSEDMLSDFDVIALYDIEENIWQDFVNSLIQ